MSEVYHRPRSAGSDNSLGLQWLSTSLRGSGLAHSDVFHVGVAKWQTHQLEGLALERA